MPAGIPIDNTLFISFISGLIFKISLMTIVCLGFLSEQNTTTIQNILDIRVDIAAPVTPIDNPNIRIAFPIILIILDITDIVIGYLALPSALKNAAPTLNNARNGYEHTVIRKYTSELSITSASTLPNISLNNGYLNIRLTEITATDNTICLAALLHSLIFLLPIYCEHIIAAPVASAENT